VPAVPTGENHSEPRVHLGPARGLDEAILRWHNPHSAVCKTPGTHVHRETFTAGSHIIHLNPAWRVKDNSWT